jgi:hypothetical protein
MNRAGLRSGRWGLPLASLVSLLALAQCVFDPSLADQGADPQAGRSEAVSAQDEGSPAPSTGVSVPARLRTCEGSAQSMRRGLGTLTARAPGTESVVGGVRLVSHEVNVVVRDGYARTEITEEFRNDTDRVLEGRYVFPVPPQASISRLALWVGARLVEGEIVERESAASIFRGIVEDTVRPRDPALLEWVRGGEFSLKIFPLPAHGNRKVVLAYDQTLPANDGRISYVYPLSLGSDRSTAVDAFSLHLIASDSIAEVTDPEVLGYPASIHADGKKLEVMFSSRGFTADSDFAVSYRRPRESEALVSSYRSAKGEFGNDAANRTREEFISVRLTTDPGSDRTQALSRARDRIVVLDASFSQSSDTFSAERKLAEQLVDELAPGERFALLACDSACSAYPRDGMTDASQQAVQGAGEWLAGAGPQGSSDLAGAMVEALSRLDPLRPAQVVYIGDGQATSGELSASAIARRVTPALRAASAELRLVGAGRTVDDIMLSGLAREWGATYDRLTTGESLEQRVDRIARKLMSPVIVGPTIELPAGVTEVQPSELPNLAVGDELTLVGKLAPTFEGGIARLRGSVNGEPIELAKSVDAPKTDAENNPIVPRMWAEGRISRLQGDDSNASKTETLELSRKYHVLCRATSLLVLENDRMFAEFGIARTTRSASEQSDHLFGRLAQDGLEADGRANGLEGSMSSAMPLRSTGFGENGSSRTSSTAAISPSFEQPVSLGANAARGAQGVGGVSSAAGGGATSSLSAATHVPRAPAIRMGSTVVSGRIPPEVIQRAVRQNFGRFRVCYERGLMRNPELKGRVTVRFVIDSAGNVVDTGNAGSDLPDAEVITCVVSSFRAVHFPAPDFGFISVVYPILFTSDGTRPQRPPSPWPDPPPLPPALAPAARGPIADPSSWGPTLTATHRAVDDSWMGQGEATLARLRSGLDANANSRSAHSALVRGLLTHGRFAEALFAAKRFAGLDPDLPAARELLAYALVVNADSEGAARTIDSLAETTPHDSAVHVRAAKAFQALGDEVRACAHWRSLADLRKGDDAAAYEALRCRAQLHKERELVLEELRARASTDSRLAKLAQGAESGQLPTYDGSHDKPGLLQVEVCCSKDTAKCPVPAVITPEGKVVSPWTPAFSRSGSRSVSLPALLDGTYRTVVVGADAPEGAELWLRTLGASKKLPLAGGVGVRSAAATTVKWTW